MAIVVDSSNVTLTLPLKVNVIIDQGHLFFSRDQVAVQEISQLIMIIKECLPRTLNVEEDHQSRSVTDSNEWKLKPLIFKKMCKI